MASYKFYPIIDSWLWENMFLDQGWFTVGGLKRKTFSAIELKYFCI